MPKSTTTPALPRQRRWQSTLRLTADDLEFVDLRNNAETEIALDGWQMAGGIEFMFKDGTILAGQERLVVLSFDPEDPDNANRLAAFRAHYGVSDQVALVGGYAGQLSDGGVGLSCFAATGNRPDEEVTILVEELLYDDVSPWPTSADGEGKSLTRTALSESVQLVTSWVASMPTPGTAQTLGDLNLDGVVDINDVDLLCAGLRNGTASWDINGDGVDDNRDLYYLIGSILNTSPGDANLDGVFNSVDMVRVFQVSEYEDNITGNSTWSEGDWDCDGEFSTHDLVVAFQAGQYSYEARQSAIPFRESRQWTPARASGTGFEPEIEMVKDLARLHRGQHKGYAISALYDAQLARKALRRRR